MNAASFPLSDLHSANRQALAATLGIHLVPMCLATHAT